MTEHKCEYPHCEKESEYLNSVNKSLYQEHYDLWNFICEVVWSAHIKINPYKSRFNADELLPKKEEQS